MSCWAERGQLLCERTLYEGDGAFDDAERAIFLEDAGLRHLTFSHGARQVPHVIVLPGHHHELTTRRQINRNIAAELLHYLILGAAGDQEQTQSEESDDRQGAAHG